MKHRENLVTGTRKQSTEEGPVKSSQCEDEKPKDDSEDKKAPQSESRKLFTE